MAGEVENPFAFLQPELDDEDTRKNLDAACQEYLKAHMARGRMIHEYVEAVIRQASDHALSEDAREDRLRTPPPGRVGQVPDDHLLPHANGPRPD